MIINPFFYGFSCLIKCVQAIDNFGFDVALFDMNLKDTEGKDGLALAAYFKEKQKKPFVFLTAYNDVDTMKYVINLSPSGYLIKPINEITLCSTIELALHNSAVESKNVLEQNPHIFLKKRGKSEKVFWKDIQIILVEKNYVEITYNQGKKGVLRTSMKRFMKGQLPTTFQDKFIRINRSQYINVDEVRAFDKNKIVMNLGEFKVSETGYKNLLRII